MGAVAFSKTIEAYSAEEAFQMLCEDARYEYGNDRYNGTISTCDMGRVKTIADKYSKNVEKKAFKMIKDAGYGYKRVADCIDMGVVEYHTISDKKLSEKSKVKAEYRQKYVIILEDDYGRDKEVSYWDTKTEADKEAMKLALKNNIEYIIKKMPVKINRGSNVVTTIRLVKKVTKTKPKKAVDGTVVKELRKYMFYGFAAE